MKTTKRVTSCYVDNSIKVPIVSMNGLVGIFAVGYSRCSTKCGSGVRAAQSVQCSKDDEDHDQVTCEHHHMQLIECQGRMECPSRNRITLYFLY